MIYLKIFILVIVNLRFTQNLRPFITTKRLIMCYFSVPYVSGIREILKVRVGEYDVSTTSEPLKHQVLKFKSFHKLKVIAS